MFLNVFIFPFYFGDSVEVFFVAQLLEGLPYVSLRPGLHALTDLSLETAQRLAAPSFTAISTDRDSADVRRNGFNGVVSKDGLSYFASVLAFHTHRLQALALII